MAWHAELSLFSLSFMFKLGWDILQGLFVFYLVNILNLNQSYEPREPWYVAYFCYGLKATKLQFDFMCSINGITDMVFDFPLELFLFHINASKSLRQLNIHLYGLTATKKSHKINVTLKSTET